MRLEFNRNVVAIKVYGLKIVQQKVVATRSMEKTNQFFHCTKEEKKEFELLRLLFGIEVQYFHKTKNSFGVFAHIFLMCSHKQHILVFQVSVYRNAL